MLSEQEEEMMSIYALETWVKELLVGNRKQNLCFVYALFRMDPGPGTLAGASLGFFVCAKLLPLWPELQVS